MTKVEELAETLGASRRALLRSAAYLTSDRAVLRPADSEWSVLEVLAHLIDTDYHYAAQAVAMRDTRDHLLVHFDDNLWKREHAHIRDIPLTDVLSSLEASHETVLLDVLAMTDADLDAPGLHPRGIPYTVQHVFLRLPQHDENHTRQIEEILAAI